MGELTPVFDADLAALAVITGHLSHSFGSIDDHQWPLATPCSDWDLAALVDHVTGGNWFTSRILAGHSADDAMSATLELFGTGSASRHDAVSSLDEQLEAFGRAEVLDRSWSHVAGQLTGRQVLHLRLHDLIVHAWDIDQTIDPPASPSEEMVRWGLHELADERSLTSKLFGLTADARAEASEARTAEAAAAAYLRSFGR